MSQLTEHWVSSRAAASNNSMEPSCPVPCVDKTDRKNTQLVQELDPFAFDRRNQAELARLNNFLHDWVAADREAAALAEGDLQDSRRRLIEPPPADRGTARQAPVSALRKRTRLELRAETAAKLEVLQSLCEEGFVSDFIAMERQTMLLDTLAKAGGDTQNLGFDYDKPRFYGSSSDRPSSGSEKSKQDDEAQRMLHFVEPPSIAGAPEAEGEEVEEAEAKEEEGDGEVEKAVEAEAEAQAAEVAPEAEAMPEPEPEAEVEVGAEVQVKAAEAEVAKAEVETKVQEGDPKFELRADD
eukprot:SAG11_NODE_1023_length_6154_cov_3.841288_4_plen_297_part_00